MSCKQTILIFLRYYLPGFQSGGPVRSVSNMVEQLSDRYDFRIITSDRDYLAHTPYPGLQGGWQTVGTAEVLYLSPAKQTWINMMRLARYVQADLIYINSLFDPKFSLPVLVAKYRHSKNLPPVICAPRGETSAGALSLKPLKKFLFLFLLRAAQLPQHIIFHATAESEKAEIQACLGKTIEPYIAGNIAAQEIRPPRAKGWLKQAAKGPLKIIFLSRIHPKKNLDFLLECLQSVSLPAELSLCGPIDDETFWAACRTQIKSLPGHISVSYHGAIEHHQVAAAMQQHHLFFFPTRGENFGHVIHEAVQAGCVLLLSDQTPWLDLSENHVGWAVPLSNKQGFIDVLTDVAGWDEGRWTAHEKAIRSYASMTNIAGQSTQNHLRMFEKVAKLHGS
ncbi:glycosyltransferase [Alphaproteobacteria bacterium]|nr:glycosyltransferase [Alphaproteobacteria bacterium]